MFVIIIIIIIISSSSPGAAAAETATEWEVTINNTNDHSSERYIDYGSCISRMIAAAVVGAAALSSSGTGGVMNRFTLFQTISRL